MLVDIIFFTAQVLIIADCITVILFVKHMIKENSNDAAV
jgi:hypothetical protein